MGTHLDSQQWRMQQNFTATFHARAEVDKLVTAHANDADAGADDALSNPAPAPKTGNAQKPSPALQSLALTADRVAEDVEDACLKQKKCAAALASSLAEPARHAAADFDGLRAESVLADKAMGNSLAAWDALTAHAPPALLEAMQPALASGRRDSAEILHAPSDAVGDGTMQDFFAELARSIGSLKTDYLGVYEDAMGKHSEFYKAFLAATELDKSMTSGEKEVTLTLVQEGEPLADLTEAEIQAAMKVSNGVEWIYDPWRGKVPHQTYPSRAEVLAEHKKKQLQRGAGYGLLGGLKALLKTFDPSSAADTQGILIKAGDAATAKKWAKDMGLPESVVVRSRDPNPAPGEEWWVTLDLQPVKNMVESLEEMAKQNRHKLDAKKIVITLPIGDFQAWKVGFEAQATEIKNISTVMAQKMANAQSIYENLIKVLSNTISSIIDTLKGFLQN